MCRVTALKRAGIVMVLVVLAWIPIVNAATDGPSTEGIVNSLLTAIVANNYDSFVANATPALKARITRETFTQVNTQLSARLKKGYKPQYCCSYKFQGVEAFVWKITFTDGGDDLLARLVMQGDKVAGFWFQ